MRRRGFLAGVAALAAFPASARAQDGGGAGGFMLSRTVRRSLPDGKHIEARRQWRIAFAPLDNGGMRVSGTQTSVDVDAPPALRALTEMEMRREEDGFLPLEIDASGHIVPTEGRMLFSELPGAVAAAALEYARARSEGMDSTASSQQFIRDLSDRSLNWLTYLPHDLFFPLPRDRSAQREIELADGTEGVVRMREAAIADPETGLLVSFLREAETATETMSRSGSETWALTGAVS